MLARFICVYARLLALIVVAVTASGCALVAVPAVGMAVMSGGASGAVKAGVEHTAEGAAYRTFSAPLAEVRAAVRDSFRDLLIDVTDDEMLVGAARSSSVRRCTARSTCGWSRSRHADAAQAGRASGMAALRPRDGGGADRANGARARGQDRRRRRVSTSSLTSAASAAGSTGLVT